MNNFKKNNGTQHKQKNFLKGIITSLRHNFKFAGKKSLF